VHILFRIYEMVAWSNVMFIAMGVCSTCLLFRINSHLRKISQALESKA